MRLRAIPGVLVALAVALAAAGGATASPEDVLADYRADGSIDGTYSVEDLRGALTQAQDTSLYGIFREAVQAALNEQIGGFQPSGGAPAAPAPAPAPRTQPSPPRSGAPSSGGGGPASGDATPASPQQERGGVAGATETERSGEPSGAEGDDPAAATPATPRLVPRARAGSVPPAPEDTADATARDISGLSAGRELPQPPSVAPGEGVPIAFLTLSAAAGALVLGGLGSAVYRRMGIRRSR